MFHSVLFLTVFLQNELAFCFGELSCSKNVTVHQANMSLVLANVSVCVLVCVCQHSNQTSLTNLPFCSCFVVQVTKFWLDDMYMSNQLPLVDNSNPFFMLPLQKFKSTSEHLHFASLMVQFSLNFKHKIDWLVLVVLHSCLCVCRHAYFANF